MIAMDYPDDLSKAQQVAAAQVRSWIGAAERLGLVVTVEQVARKPLAMGNADTLIEVRRKRETAK
jgi:hypothetical protein